MYCKLSFVQKSFVSALQLSLKVIEKIAWVTQGHEGSLWKIFHQKKKKKNWRRRKKSVLHQDRQLLRWDIFESMWKVNISFKPDWNQFQESHQQNVAVLNLVRIVTCNCIICHRIDFARQAWKLMSKHAKGQGLIVKSVWETKVSLSGRTQKIKVS